MRFYSNEGKSFVTLKLEKISVFKIKCSATVFNAIAKSLMRRALRGIYTLEISER